MTFTPVEEARAVCAKFVAASAPDEQAVELDRVHCWLTEAVPPRFLELSQHEQRNLALSPAISKLIDRVAALAQVDGLAAALMAVLCSKISNVVARAAELAAILATSFKFMQSPSRNVSLLPQSMLADAHLVRALIDLLESTESGDILKLVCIALTGIISHAPAGYDTVLARGIVRIGVTRIRQLSSSSPHLSTLLATVVFMSKHQPSAPKTTYSALGPSSRSNDGPYVRTDSEVEWRNYNFNDGPVSFASAIPLIASHIGDIEQHFKDCLLSVDDHQASALVAAGLTGVAGLIGSGIPVSVFSDTAVVSRIAYHLSRGVPEAVRLVEVVNKHGSVAAKNTIKAALPDFQVVVGDVVRVLSSLSVGTNDTVVLINQLDMIARLYSFDTGLRTSILDSMLIELLLRLLRDGEAEPVLILAAIRTLASVAQSTLSPPSGDTLARIIATLVGVVRRFDHIGLVQLAVDELCDLKFASAGLHHACSQNPVHMVLLERFDQLSSGTDHSDALESTLAILSTLIDRDDHAAVAVAAHPGLAARLCQLFCETAKPSLAATALRLWHQLLAKELIVLSLAEQDQFVSSAISLASHPNSTAYEAGIALEALYAVCNDLTLVDRHRIVALCRKLFQGSGHIAVLRPAGIVLDAVVRTLAADDAERTVIFSDIATALDPSASRSLTRRAVAILNHETGMPPKNPMSRPMNEVPSGFATSDILRALHALIVASRVNPVGEFDDMLLRDVIRVVMWYRQTSLLSVFSLHHSLQLDDAVVDIILDEACSVEVRFCALRFIIKLVNSQLRGNRDRRLKQPVLERLLLQLVGQLDSLHPHLTHLAFRLAKCAINENISEETKQSLSATCLQHCGRLRYCGAPSVPALLCAAVIVVICSPYSVDGISVALSEVADIVCDASRSIDSHPYRAHLPNCLEHLSIILRCQKLNVELPDHGKMIDAVLSIVCHDNLPEAVLKPTVLNLQKLTCDVPLANVIHYAARIQSELDLKLANSNPDAYTHTLLSLLFHSHGRPTRFRSLFKSNVLYERIVKQLDCSIDNETFPAMAELYRETIRDHSVRLSDHGIRQVLLRAMRSSTFSVCHAAVEAFISIGNSGGQMHPLDLDTVDTIRSILAEPAMPMPTKKCAIHILGWIYQRISVSRRQAGQHHQLSEVHTQMVEILSVIMCVIEELPSVHLFSLLIQPVNALINQFSVPGMTLPEVRAIKERIARYITERCIGLSRDGTSSIIGHSGDLAVQFFGLQCLYSMFYTMRSSSPSLVTPQLMQHILGIARSNQYPSMMRNVAISIVYEHFQQLHSRAAAFTANQNNAILAELREILTELSCLNDGVQGDGTVPYSLLPKARTYNIFTLRRQLSLFGTDPSTSSVSAADLLDSYCTMLSAATRWQRQMSSSDTSDTIIGSQLLSMLSPYDIRVMMGVPATSTELIQLPAQLRDVASDAFSTVFDHIAKNGASSYSYNALNAFSGMCPRSQPVFQNQWQHPPQSSISRDFCIDFVHQYSHQLCQLFQTHPGIDSNAPPLFIVLGISNAATTADEFKALLVDNGLLRAAFDSIAPNSSADSYTYSIRCVCDIMTNQHFIALGQVWHDHVAEFVAVLARAFEDCASSLKQTELKKRLSSRHAAAAGSTPMITVSSYLSVYPLIETLSPRRMQQGGNINPAVAENRLQLLQKLSEVDGENGRIRGALELCMVYCPSHEHQLAPVRTMLDEYFGGCRADLSLADLPPITPDGNPY